jgi:EpsI family protein
MRHPLARAAVICLLLAGAAVFLANARKGEAPLVRETFATFPMALAPWRAVVDPPMDDDVLKVLGVDDYLSRVYYQPNGAALGLYMGFYASQRQGDTIHSPLNCLPGAGWEAVSQGRLQIANVDGAGRDITVNRYIVQKGLDRQLVLYWYQSRDRVVASEYVSRAYLIQDAIRTNRTDGSMIRVLAPLSITSEADANRAEQLAVDFVRLIFPLLPAYLPQ